MQRAADRPDLPPEQVDLTQDMPVLAHNGRQLGVLDEARCPGAAHIAEWLVVRRGLADRRLLNNARIRGGRGSALVTDLSPSDWPSLTAVFVDDAVRDRVEAALQDSEDPAQSLLRTLTVHVAAQRVFIEGYLSGPEQIQDVERRVRTVPGVLEVHTRILTDAELEGAVTRALSKDPRTGAEPIRARAALGRIELLGQASSVEVATASDRIASAVPGVLAVHSYLAVAPPAQPFGPGRARAASRT